MSRDYVEFQGNSEAKGRNGYFRLARAEAIVIERDTDDLNSPRIHIDFLAARSPAVGPARLMLTVEDALKLHSLLTVGLVRMGKDI